MSPINQASNSSGSQLGKAIGRRAGFALCAIVNPIAAVPAILLGTALAIANIASLRIFSPLERSAIDCFKVGSGALSREADFLQGVITGKRSDMRPNSDDGFKGILSKHTTKKLETLVLRLTHRSPFFSLQRQIYARAISLLGLTTCVFPRLADAAMVIPLFGASITMHIVKPVAKKILLNKSEANRPISADKQLLKEKDFQKIKDATRKIDEKFYQSLEFTAVITDVFFFGTNFLLPKHTKA